MSSNGELKSSEMAMTRHCRHGLINLRLRKPLAFLLRPLAMKPHCRRGRSITNQRRFHRRRVIGIQTVPPEAWDPHATDTFHLQGGPATSEQSAESSPLKVRYFGDYELLSEIARGGMGVVYKARSGQSESHCRFKDDSVRATGVGGRRAAIPHGSGSGCQSGSSGIVPIIEIGEHQGQHYFSMGYVEGQSLADRIKDGPLPPKDAAELTMKIAEAIAYAHGRGVIHRDLKPANVLLDWNGEPKVTDFGLARKLEQDSGLTKTGAVMGTPSYMPPEQAAGKTSEVGPLSDVYSIGAILYSLLTGRPPFQAANPLDTLLQVMNRNRLR